MKKWYLNFTSFCSLTGVLLYPQTSILADEKNYHSDNTAKNVRDQNQNMALPENQSNKKVYIDRTAAIRQDIMDIDIMSTNAKNIKIMTLESGKVVLRGPVESSSEKEKIEAIAQRHSGGAEVLSFLEVSMKELTNN
jgi:osmotically-inducible protein OsmY